MKMANPLKYLQNRPALLAFVKYLIVGGSNFVITFGLFIFLYHVLGIHYLVCTTITWLFGLMLTYIINFVWVFKPDEKLEFKKRLPKYFTVYVASYLFNLAALKFLVDTYDFDVILIQFAIIPFVVLINFFGFKYWGLK